MCVKNDLYIGRRFPLFLPARRYIQERVTSNDARMLWNAGNDATALCLTNTHRQLRCPFDELRLSGQTHSWLI